MTNNIQYDFSNTQVLVTGGTSGIGLGIASAFVEAGANVMITGTRTSVADYADTDLSAFEYKQLQLQDVNAIKALASGLDSLDILINNAGAAMPDGDEWSSEGFEASVQLNLNSVFHMSQACLPLLKNSTMSGGACIVGIASLTSFFAQEFVPAYGAAKAGLVQMAKTFGSSWASHGIRANNVAAGLIESRMTIGLKDIQEYNDDVIKNTPLKRWGTPQDVAACALFLCSAQASYVTGQTLICDGGRTIWIQ